MDKRYAIFDMDGTLIDSMAYWENLAHEFLASKGIDTIPHEILEQIKPMTMVQSATLFIQQFHLEGTPEVLVSQMHHMMDDYYRHTIPLKQGVEAYVGKLHSQGVNLCVASATVEHLMETCLKRLGILECFDFLLSCETKGIGKDHPDIYLEAAERFGAQPQDIAVYEDAFYACKTAKDAGFYLVGVYDAGSQKHWEALQAMADETIITFEEVPQ
ncbi:HAD family phosphatase [Bengtsoniella intestinalis]|uniref:HAD family hydrolase n=1 Tax=Bengtsoniella intestinalis TaxID=3073143 RepID=UPI00391EF313